MPDLSAAATLDLWQSAEGLGAVERSLALAAAGDPGAEALATLPLGQRDARLLALHEALGGRPLEATAACPTCGEDAEFSVDAEALLADASRAMAPVPVEADGWVVEWRPPDSRDVAASAAAADAAAAEAVLLERCVPIAAGAGGQLPAKVREAVAHAMAEGDPLAEVLVDVVCPACETAFVADFNVGSFVWAELRAHALRLLREVDTLARAYGWTEAEVLALSARRRAAYLELTQEAAS